jgi:muramoyltetrapeptide carboxypeptidase
MVDRALTQLLSSGSLAGVTGITLGRFDGFEDHHDRGWTVIDVLHDRLDHLGVPILAGLPIGHGDNPRTVPLGVPCELNASSGILTVAPALA